jgi:hypothetical protein
MKIEIFTLCDAATTDTGGKLNILGSFDRLMALQAPVIHQQCALAIKLRFERPEDGQKRIRIMFVDSDGKSVMPTVDTTTQVQFQDGNSSATASIVLNIQQLKLPSFAEYSIDLIVDDRHEASIPLIVAPIRKTP